MRTSTRRPRSREHRISETSTPGRKFATWSAIWSSPAAGSGQLVPTWLLLFVPCAPGPSRISEAAPAIAIARSDSVSPIRSPRQTRSTRSSICARRCALHLKNERCQPARVERRQRAQQVVAGHHAKAVAERKVVDDARPEPIVEPKPIGRGLGQLAQLDDRPGRKHPRPDLAQLPVPSRNESISPSTFSGGGLGPSRERCRRSGSATTP